jgi:cytochrome P450
MMAPPEVIARGVAAGQALRDYFSALIETRRADLRDDILSDLIRAEEAGDRLSQDELLSQCIGLLIAGFETTIGLIGHHFCLGAHLARMEAQNAIGALVRRLDGLTLVSDELEWGRSLFRVLGKLPVRFER